MAGVFFAPLAPAVDQLPIGFREQALEPLGGRVLMPTNWHFREGATATGILYTFAQENRADGTYETGFRIQVILDVRRSGQTPEQAARAAREKFQRTAIEVLGDCEEEHRPPFRKICLETLTPNPGHPDDPFHVVTSFFWNDEADMVVVTIFGAPQSTWTQAEAIYARMQGLTLMGPRPKAEVPPAAKKGN